MRDLVHDIKTVVAIPAATYAADNTPDAVDLQGFEAAAIAIEVGIGGIAFSGTNKIEFKLTHSDDNTTFVAVTADDVQNVTEVGTGGIVHSLIAAHASASVTKVGYVGNKRYLKLLADFSGTHGTGTPISAIVILGDAHSKPVG